MLQHVREVVEKQGYKLIGLAPSTSAALTLAREAGIESKTIHKFLFKYDGVINDRGTEQGRVKMRGDLKNTVVVVDESSLASTSQMNAMLKLSKVLNFKVVLVGDTKQLNAVEAGKPFYQLQKVGMETAIMGNIQRQKEMRLKAAVYSTINQDIGCAFDRLGDNVIEVKGNEEEKLSKLVSATSEQWIGLSREERQNTILISPSHKLRSAINQEIRASLKRTGTLTGNALSLDTLVNKDLTIAEKSYINNYEVGDVILFNRSYKSLCVKQGEYHTISGVKKDELVFKSSSGKEVRFNPSKLGGTREGAIDVFYKSNLELQSGDLVRWTRNYQDSKEIVNTKVISVLSVTDQEISFKTSADNVLKLPRSHPSLKHMDYGYALTAHAAQGMTYDRVVAALESKHKHLTNQKSFYVTLSRARHEAVLLTDNKTALLDTLKAKTGEIVSVTEHQAMQYNEGYKSTSAQVNKQVVREEHVKQSYQSISTQDIYKAMYSRLPSVLPEFGFRQQNGYYISTTSQKVDGSSGKKGKVYVYANNPGVLVDYTRGNHSIWDYVKDTYMPAGNKAEVMSYLSDMAGLSANDYKPTRTIVSSFNITEPEKATEIKLDSKMLKSIDEYASKKLFASDNKVLSYLKQERGYDTDTIKKMGIGYIDSKKALAKYLRGIGFTEENVKDAFKALHYIGRTHNMVMPFKDDKGSLIGFAARNISYKETDQIGKYLYTKGLSRSSVILGLETAKQHKEVVMVEGMLDCAHAKAKGMENVVSLGGSHFNERQLKLLTESGVKSVVLALDNDKAGMEATKRIEATIKASDSDISVKVARLSAIKDPDQMIKAQGIAAFQDVISNAKTTVASKQQGTDIHKQNAPQALHPIAKPASINKDKDFDMAD
ncbi:MAG: AAA family ATPase, partial [Alphaproteobacteria bacterium]